MKNLKRYLTKSNLINLKEYFDSIEGKENQFDFLAFLVYHSFFIEKDYSEKLSELDRGGDLYFNHSLYEYHNIHIDDELSGNTGAEKGDIAGWYKYLILGALFPKFNTDEFCRYIEDSGDDLYDDSFNQMVSSSKSFMRKHKFTKKTQECVLHNFKDGIADMSEYNIIVIKSNYLVKIYKNKHLKELLESALQCMFVRKNIIMQSTVVYTESCYYEDGDFLSQDDIMRFIKEYEKIFGLKNRHFKANSVYANKLLHIDPTNIFTTECIIDDLMNTLDTKEMVMF